MIGLLPKTNCQQNDSTYNPNSFANLLYFPNCEARKNIKRIFNIHKWIYFEVRTRIGYNVYWNYDPELGTYVKADWLYSLLNGM